jgi:hypothetical protein
VDPRLAAWIERLLRKEPGERPQGAAQAWEELEPMAAEVRVARRQTDAAPAASPKGSARALVDPLNLGVPLTVLVVGFVIGSLWLVPVAVAVYAALVAISVREAAARKGV